LKGSVIKGRGAIRGVAEGIALVSRETIQGWNGIDKTGTVIEKGHPFEGWSIKDAVLVLPGAKGSNGWSIHFHSARVAGVGPAALGFSEDRFANWGYCRRSQCSYGYRSRSAIPLILSKPETGSG
jgi:predicted aconitase with swiveling domain